MEETEGKLHRAFENLHSQKASIKAKNLCSGYFSKGSTDCYSDDDDDDDEEEEEEKEEEDHYQWRLLFWFYRFCFLNIEWRRDISWFILDFCGSLTLSLTLLLAWKLAQRVALLREASLHRREVLRKRRYTKYWAIAL